jgi:hypothetical protein
MWCCTRMPARHLAVNRTGTRARSLIRPRFVLSSFRTLKRRSRPSCFGTASTARLLRVRLSGNGAAGDYKGGAPPCCGGTAAMPGWPRLVVSSEVGSRSVLSALAAAGRRHGVFEAQEGEPPRSLARLSRFDHVLKSGLKRSEASSIEENASEQESRNLFGSASITTGRP